MKLRNAWVLALALCSSGAYAADESANWYFGLAATDYKFEVSGVGNYDTDGYYIRLGYDLGSYLSVEGRVGFGDQAPSGGMHADQVTGAYARLNLPLERVKVYAIGGVSRVDAKVAGVTKALEGPSYGVGLELYGNRTTAITVEYMRYINEEKFTDTGLGIDADVDVKSVSFGFVHHF